MSDTLTTWLDAERSRVNPKLRRCPGCQAEMTMHYGRLGAVFFYLHPVQGDRCHLEGARLAEGPTEAETNAAFDDACTRYVSPPRDHRGQTHRPRA